MPTGGIVNPDRAGAGPIGRKGANQPMAIKERRDRDVVIFDVSGRVTIGEGDAEVREAVKGAVERGERKVLLNMKGVTTMDSSGLGELVEAHKTLDRLGGQLSLVHLSPKVGSVLQATQLVGVIRTYDNEDEALIDFSSSGT